MAISTSRGSTKSRRAGSRSTPARCRSNGSSEVVAAVGRALAQGAKVYWICPLVEESEETDLAAARERRQALEG